MDKLQTAKWLAAAGASVAVALSGGYLIKPQEGSVKDSNGMHVAYLDAVGVPTICYGQTGSDLYGNKIKLGMKLSEAECMEMLLRTMQKFEKDVDKMVKVPYKSDYQKAAFISFAYNVGAYSMETSTLLRKLNSGQHDEACDRLSDWVYAKKKKLGGLVKRRAEEKAWCMGQVPYEVDVNYSTIVDLVKQTSDRR